MYTLNPQKQQEKQICRFIYVKPWTKFKKFLNILSIKITVVLYM